MDAVIAWVDGSDPRHAAKRQAAMAELGMAAGAGANFVAPTRFSDLGEIYVCIASILKYAPFIRRIHVLGDDQAPAAIGDFARQGICAADRIRVVDHRELFRGYEDFLPTFSSRTLEALFWNIEGIGDEILYFNDDFFLNAPVCRADFVDDEGRYLLEGRLRSVRATLWKHRLRDWAARLRGEDFPPVRFKTAQAVAAALLGRRHYLSLGHSPRPLRTRTLAEFFAARPELLRAQLRHRFRSSEQFSPYALSNEIELAEGRARVVPVSPQVYLTPKTELTAEGLAALLADRTRRYGCVQSLDDFTPAARALLRAQLADKLAGFLPAGLDLPG